MAVPGSESDDALRKTLAELGVAATQLPSETIGAKARSDERTSTLPHLQRDVGGRFESRGELGRGAMGVVELATQHALNRDVAIKRLIRQSPDLQEALLHEAIVTGQLEHPNIVPIHAVAQDAGGPVVVMKRVSGVEWQDLIKPVDNDIDRHLEIFLSVCGAVAFAHSKGILHRDIKPSNVMIGEFGEVYLVDWGLAKQVSDNTPPRIVGTPAYMSPEMARGSADVRSDVFLLGATLHEALTGNCRHTGRNVMEVIREARASDSFRYSNKTPSELAAICNKACAADPEKRFQTAAELQDAVREYLNHRAAGGLASTGKSRYRELLKCIQEDEPYAKAQRLFNEARFAFEQSLATWPDNDDAAESRQSCIESMALYELQLGHPENAHSLVESLAKPNESLTQAIEKLRELRETERARLTKLERDQDKRVGAYERGRATLFFAAGIIVLVATFVSIRLLAPAYLSSSLRLLLVSAVVFLVGSAVVDRWRRGAELNLINRRIAQIIVGTLALSVLNRFLGYMRSAEIQQILQCDAMLLTGSGLCLSPFHGAGRWLTGCALLVAVFGSIWPEWIELMYIGLAITMPAGFLITRKKQSKA